MGPRAFTILANGPSSPFSFFLVIVVSESSFVNNLKGWSNSVSRPRSMTKILSESMTVANLCAIMRTVQFLKLFLSYSWMKLSVSRSTLAVASSSTRILVSLMIALARQRSCFYPIENKLLLSDTRVEIPFLKFFSIWVINLTSCKVFIIRSSLYSLNGSKFSLILPWIKNGAWGM